MKMGDKTIVRIIDWVVENVVSTEWFDVESPQSLWDAIMCTDWLIEESLTLLYIYIIQKSHLLYEKKKCNNQLNLRNKFICVTSVHELHPLTFMSHMDNLKYFWGHSH